MNPLKSYLTVAVIALSAGACSSATDDLAGNVGGPVLSDVSLMPNPNPTVPLAAILSLATDRPAQLTINFDDGERRWSVTPGDGFATRHEVPVIGMRAGREHMITATLADGEGNETVSEPLRFETPPLPPEFPRPIIRVRTPELMQPGVTVFNVNGRWNAEDNYEPRYFGPVVIVNDLGEIVWYYLPADHRAHDVQRLENGNLVYQAFPDDTGQVEIDMLGNVVRHWQFRETEEPEVHAILVDTDNIHHEMVVLPNGNMLFLSMENRVVENWPANYGQDGETRTANVVGDVVVEMTPAGEIVNEWSLHDFLDPYRIGWNSLRENPRFAGRFEEPAYEWAHANAVIYDEKDHSFIVSAAYLDAVVKVSMDTGEIVWILGTHDNWREPWSDKLLTPVGEVEWFWKQHAPTWTEHGTLLIFDNDAQASTPPEPIPPLETGRSRAVEYRIDEEAMTVEQVWEYGPDDELFHAVYLGDVDWLSESDTILITVGGRVTDEHGVSVPLGQGQRWASLMEVTHEQPAQKVWHMDLKSDDVGWAVYRAGRLSGVYP